MNYKSEDKYSEKRQEIMEYALDCFSKQGFTATTIKTIAAAAGMKSTALIYYYFKDKDELFQACMMDAEIPPIKQISLQAEPEEFLYQIQISFLEMINTPKIRKLLICSSSVIEARPDLMDSVNEKYRQPYKKLFIEFIEFYKKNGIFRNIDSWQLYLDVFTPLFMRCIIVRDWGEWDKPEKRRKYEIVIKERTKNLLFGILGNE
ncbi:TetR/AcrR family transcriptional regulator [Lachnospiraceae bacterium 62-35]